MSSNEKETYQKKVEDRLKILQNHITALEKQIRKAEADIEIRYDQKLQQVRGQYVQTKEKLDELRESDLNEWPELKEGVEQALNALSEAVDRVDHHISAQPNA